MIQIHTKYLSKLEDLFYKSLFENRIRTAQQSQTGQQQPQQQQVMPGQQPQQQQQTPQISSQFLDAVSRGGNSMNMLNDQQRRALEGRRASGQTQTPTPTNPNQALPQMAFPPGQTPGAGRPPTDMGILVAMRSNPKMAAFWVKSKEEYMKNKLSECCLYTISCCWNPD